MEKIECICIYMKYQDTLHTGIQEQEDWNFGENKVQVSNNWTKQALWVGLCFHKVTKFEMCSNSNFQKCSPSVYIATALHVCLLVKHSENSALLKYIYMYC